MADYEIREYREGDEHSLLETFNHVFGTTDPGFRARTLTEWRWAFRDNPAGWRIFVALHEGRVVGQFAGQPLRVWIAGEERTFVHCVDSMTHPDHRRGLKRPGLFVNVASAFFEHYGGPDRDLVHFGLPIEEAARVGKTFLKYEVVRNQIFLGRELTGVRLERPPEVRTLDRFDHQVRWLYDRCAGDWGASTIRDDAFYDWRFVDHPRCRYVRFGVHDADEVLRGVAIYRATRWEHERVGFVAEWLVPPGEPEVADLLARAVTAQAVEDGLRWVVAAFPEWSPWFVRLQELDWVVFPSPYCMWSRSFHKRWTPEWLRAYWWYQLGETDLV